MVGGASSGERPGGRMASGGLQAVCGEPSGQSGDDNTSSLIVEGHAWWRRVERCWRAARPVRVYPTTSPVFSTVYAALR